MFGFDIEQQLVEARGSGGFLRSHVNGSDLASGEAARLKGSTATVARQTVLEGGGNYKLDQLAPSTQAAGSAVQPVHIHSAGIRRLDDVRARPLVGDRLRLRSLGD